MLVANIPGTVSFSPFGSNTRAIVITVDPDRLRAHNFSPEDVVMALDTGNVVTPSGNLYPRGRDAAGAHQRHGRRSAGDGQHPHSTGQGRLHPRRGHDPGHHRHQLRLRLVNGRKSVYIPVVKKDTASTLTVVQQIHNAMPLFRSVVPEDVNVRYEFDESPTVRAAIKSVATEGRSAPR